MDNRQRVWTNFCVTCSTLGPIGDLLPLPGTFGSLVGLLFFLLVKPNPLFFVVLFFLSLIFIQVALNHFNKKDPSVIILDEFVGMILAAMLCPVLSTRAYIALFFLFRAFDIAKPWPISFSERLPGALGVVIDDCLAGIAAFLIIKLALYIGIIGL